MHKQATEQFPVTFPPNDNAKYNVPISLSELKYALGTSISRTPGPDKIPYCFLQHFTAEQLLLLLQFYNYIFFSGFPHQWRESHIIPLLKPSKAATLVSSYRPIALTNTMCKVLERILNRRLIAYLETISFFTNIQSGFRASHSTLDNISRLEHDARHALISRQYCTAVFLDVAQAFDTVWHQGLLLKIKQLGLCGQLAYFIQNFLYLRRIRVQISSTLSSSFPVYAGVPQGSVLSPTLFNIYINDLFSSVSPNIHTSLYADDGALWTTEASLTVALGHLQLAINSLVDWSNRWGLSISISKTSALIFTRCHIGNPSNIFYLIQIIFLLLDMYVFWG